MAIFDRNRPGSGQPSPQVERMLREVREQAPIVDSLRDGPAPRNPIGASEIAEAAKLLGEYKAAKANLERRIIQDEEWWKMRHWEIIRGKRGKDTGPQPEPTSAWLFNAIVGKHADVMDNYPEALVLPRERSDEQSARTLSSVLPVIMEQSDHEQVYSDASWSKIIHGTAVYAPLWNPQKENGLGDIDIREVDLLKLFWEPGITDIQRSRNVFCVELVDEKVLEAQYPEHVGKLGGRTIDVGQYIYDDAVDVSGKSVVVDWYYKKTQPDGRTVLHYAKFVGDTLLFASENDPNYRERGWYDHGLYPFVFDVLYPVEGTPVGFGYVAICKDPQLYIDKLSANIMENAMMTTKKRWFIRNGSGVNKEQFANWNEPFVDIEGSLDEDHLREIVTQPLSGIYLDVMNMKIEEMKDTASNRDVNSGSSGSGVTAAAAIAALQEAGNKTSRDMIAASYRAHTKVAAMCIELIRQFYEEKRSFRITGASGDYEFVDLSNAEIVDRQIGTDSAGTPLYRRPIFDLKIKAQKKNPFSRMEQNARAQELYGMGFFNPERAQEALAALDMMDFEGIEKVRAQVREGETLMNTCKQLMQQLDRLAAITQAVTGKDMGLGGTAAPVATAPAQTATPSGGGGIADAVAEAQTPMTDYGTRLAARSRPNMDVGSNAAMPRS